jgi:DNA primase
MEIPAYLVSPTFEHKKHTAFVLRWGIRDYPGLMYDVKQERTVFPIHYRGRLIDAVGRAVGKRAQPKWYRYTGAADYFTAGKGDVVLLVEDVVSAIVATQLVPNVTALAILGTSLSKKHMDKVGTYRKAVVALDPDAMDKTLQFSRDIRLWTGIETVAMKLFDDIKYKVSDDVKQLKEICR